MEFIRYLSVWDKLTAEEQKQIVTFSHKKQYKKGEFVHSSGDCMGLLLITSGQLRAFMTSEDGREITLYRLFERDICLFSASCMMKSIQFDITIAAEKDTDVIVIPADIYKKIMETSAPLAGYTNEVMASRFSDVMWLVEQIMWKSFDKRLADFLLNESMIEGSDILHITHEMIGNHMGNPREVVTRMLKYFAAEGMVRLSRGTVELLDHDKLMKTAD